jgi:hypothetical protein
MKVLNWALPQSNTFGIAALYPPAKARGFTAKLIKNHHQAVLYQNLMNLIILAFRTITPTIAIRFIKIPLHTIPYR